MTRSEQLARLPTLPTGCDTCELQEQQPPAEPIAVAVKPKASPAPKESAVSGGLRVPTSLRSAAAMALEREEEAAAARRKRIDEMAIVRKVSFPGDLLVTLLGRCCLDVIWFSIVAISVRRAGFGPCDNVCQLQSQHSRAVAYLLQTRLLRSALEWGAEMLGRDDDRAYGGADVAIEPSESVKIMMWPPGEFKRLPRGTTAGSCFRTYVRAAELSVIPGPGVNSWRQLKLSRACLGRVATVEPMWSVLTFVRHTVPQGHIDLRVEASICHVVVLVRGLLMGRSVALMTLRSDSL